MHLVRVQLPDRPGSLGQVASAMGDCGADISAMEIVERGDRVVVDDFMLTLPAGVLVDELVSACQAVADVRVLWVSRYPDSWGLQGDLEVLDQMLADPDHAAEVLTLAAPAAYHCQWAALLDREGGLLLGTDQAPPLTPEVTALMAPLDVPHRQELAAGWLPLWGDAVLAVCPLPGDRTLVLGRLGGPAFFDSILRRVRHLAELGDALHD